MYVKIKEISLQAMGIVLMGMGQKVIGQSGSLLVTGNVAQEAKEFAQKNVHQRVCFEPGKSSKLLTVRHFRAFQSIKPLQFLSCFDSRFLPEKILCIVLWSAHFATHAKI